MSEKGRRLFLERRSYRRRRVMDALKLLVFLGTVLWMVPALWPDGADPDVGAIKTSHALFYIFSVWLLLIVLAAIFERFQRDRQRRPEPADPPS